jgi:hypothetical protein
LMDLPCQCVLKVGLRVEQRALEGRSFARPKPSVYYRDRSRISHMRRSHWASELS